MSELNSQSQEITTSDVSGESLVDEVRLELSDIDATDIENHAQRFAALHEKLEQSLRSIDNL